MPAGGGRPKGGGLSFSTESLGFGRGEMLPSAVLSPPPTFPPLNNKPVKLDSENEFRLNKSTELRNYFRSSQYYLGAEDDSLPDLDLDWSQFPEELRPNFGKKKKMMKSSVKRNIAKKKSNVDIETTLSNLEQKENKAEADGEAKQEVDEDSEEEGEEGKQSEQGSEAEEPDEEMDGGTDYANNYFDNGEDYVDDEDDNLDEGGIY